MVDRAHRVRLILSGNRLPLPSGRIAAIAAVYLVVLVSVGLRWGGDEGTHVVANSGVTLSLALFLFASIRTVHRLSGDPRRAWILIATGAGLLLMGQIAWDYSVLLSSIPPPPSLSDVGTLVAVPAFIAGFLYLGQSNRLTRMLLALDMIGVACGLAILFTTIFWADFQHSQFDLAGRITILLYPTLYGTLGGAICFLPIKDTWRAISRRLLTVGLLADILPSLVSSPSLFHQGFTDNLVLVLVWMVSGLLVSLSALTFQPLTAPEFKNQVLGASAWVTIVSSAGAIIVAYWHFQGLTLTPDDVKGIGGLITAMIIVLVVRLGLTLNYSRGLVHQVQQSTQALQESEEFFRVLFERIPDGLVLFDPHDSVRHSPIIASNLAAATMNGYTKEELIGQSINLLTQGRGTREDVLVFLEQIRQEGVLVGETTHFRKSGSAYPVEYSSSIVTLRGKELILGIDRDITERKHAEAALEHRALHDPLTDLPNRSLLRDRLHQALLSSQRNGAPTALFFTDLDRFKEVNDSYGHHVGDALLTEVARRLRRAVGSSNTVARLGGDEFAVLLPDTDRIAATIAIQSIIATFREPLQIEDQTLDIAVSIGCALYPDHGDDASMLMRHADIAMYAAKRTGSVYAFYGPELATNDEDRLDLMHDLRRAFKGDQLTLHFQPLLNLKTGRVGEVEALVRWNHPVHGQLPPDRFIPAAEESGLIAPLSWWVLDEALRCCAEWKEEGLDVGVAVNFSARTLHDQQMATEIAAILEKRNVDPGRLTVEITESAIILDPAGALRTLTQLRAMGVRIAIDDFGTGYSSLAHLKRLPVDQIKVDRSFVFDLSTNVESASIVRSVIDLGRNLGLQVVAEGVEDQPTEELLRSMECDLIQGYHISKPLPAAAIGIWLRNARLRPSRLHLV
jgi:diguanylate cyclase (GGDEF)-like protein/PAS domain S-box-containing protein